MRKTTSVRVVLLPAPEMASVLKSMINSRMQTKLRGGYVSQVSLILSTGGGGGVAGWGRAYIAEVMHGRVYGLATY